MISEDREVGVIIAIATIVLIIAMIGIGLLFNYL